MRGSRRASTAAANSRAERARAYGSRVRSLLPSTVLVAWTLLASTAFADGLDDAAATRCTPDARLIPAATRALDDPRGFTADELRADTQARGLRAPSVYALVLDGGAADAVSDAVVRWLTTHAVSPSLSRCAVARRGRSVAVALAPRAVDVHPRGASSWHVELPAEVRDATLVATSARATALRVPVDARGDVAATLDARTPWTLQVVADDGHGPAPLATWTEGARDDAEVVRDDALWSTRHVLAAVNAMRARAGLAALRRDPMLDEVARRHAAALAVRGAVEHTPSADDTPWTRLRDAGGETTRVAEDLARASTLTEAHQRLARSPSHRVNLLDAEVDAVGIGIARAGGAIYLVEMFAARPSMAAQRAEVTP